MPPIISLKSARLIAANIISESVENALKCSLPYLIVFTRQNTTTQKRHH